MISSDNAIVGELINKFGESDISKPRLVMAVHYYLKDKMLNGYSNFSIIENKILELTNSGLLIENEGRYKIA